MMKDNAAEEYALANGYEKTVYGDDRRRTGAD